LGEYSDGPVSYVGNPSPPHRATEIDLAQVEEFGLDAVLAVHIRENLNELFFTKDLDWATEREYRCVVLGPDPEPIYVDVSDHIRGVILGDAFPTHQIATVHHAVDAFRDVQVATIHYQNGRPILLPSIVPRKESTDRDHQRSGSMAERAVALAEAEREARDARGDRSAAIAPALSPLLQSVERAARHFRSAGDVHVSVFPSRAAAIPPAERQPAPGVPSEILQSEGAQCVVEHQPQQSFTLSMAVGVQLLKDQRLRMYALIATEVWKAGESDRQEVWRAEAKAGKSDDPADVAKDLADELDAEWAAAVVAFDERRHSPVPTPEGSNS
jgi:hypothetical protein